MRFDDTLDTVLSGGLDTPLAAQSAWRQIVDLIGRGRIAADARALATLNELQARVPLKVRAASARALVGAAPPAELVRLFACDEIAVAAPVLRFAVLPPAAWIALLPDLAPQSRAILRHRRDLDGEVTRALASFGSVDFVLSSDDRPDAEAPADRPIIEHVPPQPAPEPVPELVIAMAAIMPPEPEPFRAVGAVAQGIPVVAEALRQGRDEGAREQEREQPGETFRIADVVARIEAYQRDQEAAPPPYYGDDRREAAEDFSYETDATGAIRWVEGVARGPLIGLSLAHPAMPGEIGLDGVASGAFRARSRFSDAHLVVAGASDAAGEWRLSGTPGFDIRTGRFTGYRGSARRPRTDERPGRQPTLDADAMRQLVHELRTPTNAIAGFSEMIEHAMLGPVPDPYRDQARTIRADAHGLLAAIDDLDTAARIEAGALDLHLEPVAMLPLLTRIAADLAPLADTRGARLSVEGDAGAVSGDTRALHRLLERLLATMLGAAAAGETVTIGAGDAGEVIVSRPRALAGIAAEALFTTDDESNPASLLGSGFALRLVRNLVHQLHGTLAIGDDSLTLRLPTAGIGTMEQARLS